MAAINLKVDRITINSSISPASWVQVTFQQPFTTVPVVVVLPTNSNPEPASVRIRNVTATGFEMGVVEPQGEDGTTLAMTVDYFAAEVGLYDFGGGNRMLVSTHTTATYLGKNAPGASASGDVINFPGGTYSKTPAIVAQVQTINSQPGLAAGMLASPWLETTITNVTKSSFRLGLERAETNDGTVLAETIGYIAFNSKGVANIGPVTIRGLQTNDNIVGWDNSCKTNNFPKQFNAIPLVVASQNTRDGGDGGWLRRCSISKKNVGLIVDEDQAADSERAHTTERAGLIAISDIFNDTFSGLRLEANRAIIPAMSNSVQWTQVSFPMPFSNTP